MPQVRVYRNLREEGNEEVTETEARPYVTWDGIRDGARALRESAELEPVRGDYSPGVIRPVDLAIIEDHQVNGAWLAYRLEELFGYYADVKIWEQVLSTLWVMSTWLRKPDGLLAFTVHPRWMAIGEPGSGKTRLLEIIDALSHRPSGIMTNVTPAFVRDAMADQETLTLDEVHRLFRRGGGKPEIQSAVAAHKATARSGNGIGGLNNRSLFGPIAIAARPSIVHATGGLMDGALADLFSRASPLILTEPSSRTIPDQDARWDVLVENFRKLLAGWGRVMSPKPTQDNPKANLWPIHEVPDLGSGRKREISLAYLAVADRLVNPVLMREQGRDTRWAERARRAVMESLDSAPDAGADIIASIEARFAELGISMEES